MRVKFCLGSGRSLSDVGDVDEAQANIDAAGSVLGLLVACGRI